MLSILAPAKLNLTLEVLAKRRDGFHEIRSVIQTVALCDNLGFWLSQNTGLKSDAPNWIPEESLVSKATTLLRDTSRCSKGATIEIKKRIPLVSGLGGDSSDAAATLLGLNQLWELDLSRQELLGLASQLGSDVAFFLYGGTALIEGRGEVITSLPPLPTMWIVLLVPPLPKPTGKTAQLYHNLKASYYTDGQITDRFVVLLTSGREVIPATMFNVFDTVALDSFSGLKRYQQLFLKAGGKEVHLAGSGPALFTLVKDKVQAERLYQNLQQQGLESYLTETLASRETVE